MSGGIFISYRRDDADHAAGRLALNLEKTFQRDQLFMDVDNIEPGLNFVKELSDKVASCEALLAIIGPHWLDVTDETGQRRLDNPHDFVRIEIEAALKRDVRVVPVLVDGAQMPREQHLPESLRELSHRQAVRLSHERFSADAEGLAKALEKVIKAASPVTNLSIEHIVEAPKLQTADAADRQQANKQSDLQVTIKSQQWLKLAMMPVVVVAVCITQYLLANALHLEYPVSGLSTFNPLNALGPAILFAFFSWRYAELSIAQAVALGAALGVGWAVLDIAWDFATNSTAEGLISAATFAALFMTFGSLASSAVRRLRCWLIGITLPTLLALLYGLLIKSLASTGHWDLVLPAANTAYIVRYLIVFCLLGYWMSQAAHDS
jgi:hypothetical protein